MEEPAHGRIAMMSIIGCLSRTVSSDQLGEIGPISKARLRLADFALQLSILDALAFPSDSERQASRRLEAA